MGLIARALEIAGIATVVVAWNAGRIRLVNPPRAVITRLERGLVFGHPDDEEEQQRVLTTALELLEQDAPLPPITLREIR